MISKESKEYILHHIDFVEKSLLNVEDATKRISSEGYVTGEEYKSVMELISGYIKEVSMHLGNLGTWIVLEEETS
jgi:hypothetical protein